ncbi:hypothetical protein GP486_007483, partial [Trichoglossum hirsutum]
RPFIKHSSGHSALYLVFHKLITRPSPLPSFLTNHNIPDLLRLAVFVGLNVLWGWNRLEYTSDYDLYGWLTIANGGLGLLLAARNNLFAVVARIPSTTLLMYHRWVGIATVVHATIHFAFLIHPYVQTGQAGDVIQTFRIQMGLMAWISLCLIAITSIKYVRRRWFEAFYYPHALFILFVIGALIHASHGPEFLLPGLILWAIDRVVRFVYNFRRIDVRMAEQHSGNMTKLRFRGMRTSHPGQIAWIQIPGVSFLNWHPFTIAAAPGEEAAVAVRSLGGYTNKLQSFVREAKALRGEAGLEEIRPFKMRVDGPYGVGHIEWGVHPVTVLVAGGIGITPGISIMSYIIQRAGRPDVQINSCQQWHVHLLWVVKDEKHVEWFAEELKHLEALASAPSVPATLDITIHATGSARPRIGGGGSNQEGEAYEMGERNKYQGPGNLVRGRPDMMKWFEYVRSLHCGLDTAVNVCGPRPLVDSVRKAAASASVHGGVFHVEEEVFEF